MKLFSDLRHQKGFSQRKLARLAAISYKTLQLMEGKRHNPRLSSLEKVATALGFPKGEVERTLSARFSRFSDSVEAVSERIAEEGEDSWKHRLFELVDAFRRRPAADLLEAPPRPGISVRVRCLLASTVESLCAEHRIAPPWWCAGIHPLSSPWFVSESENLKATALVESPLEFRKRNIFVLGNFLSRA